MINTIARAQLLTAATFGIWLAARVDPASAAQACDASAACIRSWHQPPAAARERKPARPAVSLTRHTARARPAPEGGGQRGQVLGPQRRGLPAAHAPATQAACRIAASGMPAGTGRSMAALCAVAAGSLRKLTAPILSPG